MRARIRNLWNILYFHRKRTAVTVGFCSAYGYTCYEGTRLNNELLRMGVAGSLGNVIVESMFHFLDTVNVRAKVSDVQHSSIGVIKHIYRHEGVYGFFRGFSAMFYGSVFCGFIYFSLYKFFKGVFKDLYGENFNIAWTFFTASFVAEFFTLLVYYPYDLIKCRLQSSDFQFKYKNLVHAFSKEIRQNSFLSLY